MIKCPKCGMVSFNKSDEREKYCGFCNEFHEDMLTCKVCGSRFDSIPTLILHKRLRHSVVNDERRDDRF